MCPILSVIIPVYNSRKYIEESVNSVLAGTVNEIEVLIVDDGSTDGTAEICDELQKKDKRVRVFHQQNAGVSAARNRGLRMAEGKYFAFVDSDDYVEKDIYQKLIMALESNGADMACCGFYQVHEAEAGRLEVYGSNYEEGIVDGYSALKLLMVPSRAGGISTISSNKLGKRKIQQENQIYFDETLYECEDGAFWCDYICAIEKAALLSEPLYYYRVWENSVSQICNIDEKKLTNLQAWNHIISRCGKISWELSEIARMRYQLYVKKMLFRVYCVEGNTEQIRKLLYQLKVYRKQFYFSKELSMVRKAYWFGCSIIVRFNMGKKTALMWGQLKDSIKKRQRLH